MINSEAKHYMDGSVYIMELHYFVNIACTHVAYSSIYVITEDSIIAYVC